MREASSRTSTKPTLTMMASVSQVEFMEACKLGLVAMAVTRPQHSGWTMYGVRAAEEALPPAHSRHKQPFRLIGARWRRSAVNPC